MFKEKFDKYVCEFDNITCQVGEYTIEARIERDYSPDRPDERDDGFWPSTLPSEAGYIGTTCVSAYNVAKAKADKIMKAWENDEWFYCGVVLKVSIGDIELKSHAASLWGIECNYPGSDNSYLTEVANELIDEAIEVAKHERAHMLRQLG